MHYQHFLIDAVNEVLAWDIPDEALMDAVKAQTGLMAGSNPEEFMAYFSE